MKEAPTVEQSACRRWSAVLAGANVEDCDLRISIETGEGHASWPSAVHVAPGSQAFGLL